MKRIGIEVQRLFRPKKHGMEIVALELIKQLQHIDSVNEYVLFAKSDIDSQCVSETQNFKIRSIPGKTYFDWEQFVLPKAVKKERLDLLHSTCNTSALNTNIPLLLTLHDIIYLESVNFKGTTYQNLGNLYRKWVVPKIVKKSHLVITVSNFEKNTIIEKMGIPEEKVVVIHNAVGTQFHNRYPKNSIAEIKAKYQLPPVFMLFLGNTAPKKNTPRLLGAYIDYCMGTKDPVPMVILDYEKRGVEQLLNEKGQMVLLKQFVFPGFVAAAEMPLLYNAAAMFLYPSLRESFGLPILEAMACGTPVITSNTSSMPEIAGEAALYVDPLNGTDITEKIFQLISNEALREEYSHKGIKRAEMFNWSRSAEALLAIYNRF